MTACGYVPVTGGVTPYLSIRARAPRYDRRLLERAVFVTHEICVFPFARGSRVLAPVTDAAQLLAAARPAAEGRWQALRGAVDERRLVRAREAVLGELATGPLTSDELRDRLPAAIWASLGEAGRRAGLPTLASLALDTLAADGVVLPLMKGDRLDAEELVHVVLRRPVTPVPRPDALATLALRYFDANPGQTMASFAWWCDAGHVEARVAIAAAGLCAVTVEGQREPGYLRPALLEEFHEFAPPSPPRLAFVPFRDPIVEGVRELRSMLPARNQHRALSDAKGRLVPGGGNGIVRQHFVVHGGMVAGIWDYDHDSRAVRYATFDPLPTRMRRAADDAADELGAFIAQNLGGAPIPGAQTAEDGESLDAVVASWKAPAAIRA